jgi:hypothetical protein
MHAAGVETQDPVDVGAYLAAVRAPADDMISAVLDELSTD